MCLAGGGVVQGQRGARAFHSGRSRGGNYDGHPQLMDAAHTAALNGHCLGICDGGNLVARHLSRGGGGGYLRCTCATFVARTPGLA